MVEGPRRLGLGLPLVVVSVWRTLNGLNLTSTENRWLLRRLREVWRGWLHLFDLAHLAFALASSIAQARHLRVLALFNTQAMGRSN